MAEILLIEPFYGGSHKQLIDTIYANVEKCVKFTLPGKKWHWRARTSALYFSETIPASHSYRVLFTSAVLNLTELLALRPDLAALRKVIYFHENQLVYPVRKQQDRDFQYGYNQILSCLVADEVVFNSHYNMSSFLHSVDSFLKLIPDHRPKGLAARIAAKSSVLYFPLALPPLPSKEADKNFLDGTPSSVDQTSCSQTVMKHSDVLQGVGSSTGVQCGEIGIKSADSSSSSLHQTTSSQTGVEISVDLKDLGINRDSHSGKTDKGSAESRQPSKHQRGCDHIAQPPGVLTDDHSGQIYTDSTERAQAPLYQASCEQQGEDFPKDLQDCDSKTGSSVPIHSVYASEDQLECIESTSAVVKPMRESEQCNESNLEEPCSASDKLSVQETSSSADKDAQNVVAGDGSAELGLQQEERREGSSRLSSLPPHRGDVSTLHIVWPHRWEHDKDPKSFFEALYSLQKEGLPFLVSVLGEQFTDVPEVFVEARERLGPHIAHWGFQASKDAFLSVLAAAHVVVSTAQHEFFGVAMLEAVHAGCFPLCPKRLVYPEIFPKECLYNTQQQLVKKLRHFCQRPYLAQRQRPEIDLERFSWRTLQANYKSLLSA